MGDRFRGSNAAAPGAGASRGGVAGTRSRLTRSSEFRLRKKSSCLDTRQPAGPKVGVTVAMRVTCSRPPGRSLAARLRRPLGWGLVLSPSPRPVPSSRHSELS